MAKSDNVPAFKHDVVDAVLGDARQYAWAVGRVSQSSTTDLRHYPDGTHMLIRSSGDWSVGVCVRELPLGEPLRGRIRVYPRNTFAALKGKAMVAEGVVIGNDKHRYAIGRRHDGVVLVRLGGIITTAKPAHDTPAYAPKLGVVKHNDTYVPAINDNTVDPARVYVMAGMIPFVTNYDTVVQGVFDATA